MLKFSEIIMSKRDIVSPGLLYQFDEYLERNSLKWTILMDGAENLYLIIARKGEDLMTQGVVVPEDDLAATIDGCVNE